MIIMQVMKMAIVQIVHMPLMAYCGMTTIGTVPVRMIRMMILIASDHRDFPFFLAGQTVMRFGSMLDGAFHQMKDVTVRKRNSRCALLRVVF
jgi:hypothetical protein